MVRDWRWSSLKFRRADRQRVGSDAARFHARNKTRNLFWTRVVRRLLSFIFFMIPRQLRDRFPSLAVGPCGDSTNVRGSGARPPAFHWRRELSVLADPPEICFTKKNKNKNAITTFSMYQFVCNHPKHVVKSTQKT